MKIILKISIAVLITISTLSCTGEKNVDFLFQGQVEKGNFIDSRDGNVYKTITIGNQTWMAENLKFRMPRGYYDGCATYYGVEFKVLINTSELIDTLDRNVAKGLFDKNIVDRFYRATGLKTTISIELNRLVNFLKNPYDPDLTWKEYLGKEIVDAIVNVQNRSIIEQAEKYEDKDYVNEYGYLYTLKAALSSLPEGWRLPTDEDWKQLEKTLGIGSDELDKMEEWRGINQGELLQLDDKIGFYGKLAGAQVAGYSSGYPENGYVNKGVKAYFWTSTASDPVDSLKTTIVRELDFKNRKIYRGVSINDEKQKTAFFSVRGVKNEN